MDGGEGSGPVGLFGLLRRIASFAMWVSMDVDVAGFAVVGGLVGINEFGYITDSYVTGSVAGVRRIWADWPGGIVVTSAGSHFSGSRSRSGNRSGRQGGQFIGGLVGLQVSGAITASYASGRVSGDDLRRRAGRERSKVGVTSWPATPPPTWPAMTASAAWPG